jgi:hypothetical protein
MKGLPNNANLDWYYAWGYAKGPETEQFLRFRAEAAQLLGIKE